MFNLLKYYVLQTECIYLLCMVLRINSHYFVAQHRLAFITETGCVYSAVRADPLNVVQVELCLQRAEPGEF